MGAGGTRTAAKLRQNSEESSLTSTPPGYQPTTTKRVLSKLSEDFAVKWLHYGPSPDDRHAPAAHSLRMFVIACILLQPDLLVARMLGAAGCSDWLAALLYCTLQSG